MTIQILAPDVAAKIAAGEVVERPANVAKELIENSLDADAREIRVEVREGGQRLLRVSDDGQGIPEGELHLAFERHATSKLHRADDLFSIGTFGFRGEALYSVAAVSHVTLTSRHRDQEFGAQVRLEGGVEMASGRAGAPVGTVITVEHLFFNTPARKQFLRTPTTEAGHIAKIVRRYALAYPDRRFSFVNEGRLVFQSTGSGRLLDVVAKVYGAENAAQMVPVGITAAALAGAESGPGLDEEVDFMEFQRAPEDGGAAGASQSGGGPIPTDQTAIRVSGYTSLPTLTRANRSQIELFVNRRYVEDSSLTYAVVQAYHTLLQVGRSPLAAIFIELDPAQVDVNVHPQKIQVRFREERRVFSAVQKAVRRAVIGHATVPDMGMAGETGPGDQSSREGAWMARRDVLVNAGFRPGVDLPDQPNLGLGALPLGGSGRAGAFDVNVGGGLERGDVAPPPQEVDGETGEIVGGDVDPARSSSQENVGRPHPEMEEPRKLPPLRVVGQVGAMYIVTEGPEGMFLIDQHAAHERIMYERFMAQGYGTVAGAVPRQHLLEPLTLHVGHELTGLVAEHLDKLAAVGYEVEPFGGDTFLVRAVPSVMAGADPLTGLEEIARGLAEERNLVGETLEQRLVKMVCKRASIKAGQVLSDIEMAELVRQLEGCQSPRTCPHGRPTMIQLTAGQLEKAFGRI